MALLARLRIVPYDLRRLLQGPRTPDFGPPLMNAPSTPQQEPARHGRATAMFHVVAIALTLLGIAPLWCTDILPTVDTGSHLHLMTILHNLGSDPVLQQHYIPVHAIVPYLSYYKLVDWLAYLGGVEWANRVILSACLAAVPWSALSLLRAARHDRWLVLAVFPWMLNADFFMGFLNFLMSIPIFFWMLAAHLRLLQRPSWRRAAVVVAWLCLQATTHYLLWAVGLALLPTLSLVMGVRQGWRQTLWWPLRDLLLGLPSIAVLLPWFLTYFVLAEGVRTSDQTQAQRGAGFFARLSQVYAGEHLGPIENVRQMADRMFDALGTADPTAGLARQPGEIVSAIWLLGMALWLVGAARASRPVPPVGSKEVSGSSYVGWSLCLTTIAYFVFPQHLVRPIWLHGVNFRLIEVLAILGVLSLALKPLQPQEGTSKRVWLGTALLLAAAVALPILTARAFVQTRKEYGAIREAYAAIPPGKSVLTLRSKRASDRFRYHIFNNIGEYYGVMRGGYVPYSFADTSSKPVVVNKATAFPAPPWDQHDAFSWRDHGHCYDYIALYDEIRAAPAAYERELPKDLKVIFRRNHWRVLRNPHPDDCPDPTAETLSARAEQGAQRLAVRTAVAECLGTMGLSRVRLAAQDELLAATLAQVPWGFVRLEDLGRRSWPWSAPLQSPRPERPSLGPRMPAPLPRFADPLRHGR